MSAKISASVGEGGVNRRDDIWAVQAMLIKFRKRSGQTAIGLDGRIGPETIGAIKSFQKDQFGWNPPDGRVDVRGRTLEHLNQLTDAAASPQTYLLEPVTIKRRGKWEVAIGADGEIRVKAGDWLSKYSAAIDDNFYTLWPYMRPNGDGQFVEITNKNLIRAGESIYHIPTFLEFYRKNSITPPPVPKEKPITELDKKKATEDFLKAEFKLQGERAQALSDALSIVSYTDSALSLAEVAGVIAEGTVIAGAATAIAIGAIFADIVGNVIAFLNAHESGTRMTGCRAACYAVTAWAFNEPKPQFSKELETKVRSGGLNDLPKHKKAWDECTSSAVNAIVDASLGKMKHAGEKSRRALIEAARSRTRGLGNGNRKDVCLFLMKQCESKFTGIHLSIWKSGYDFLYNE
jgi:hypothetical protein